MNTKNLLHSRLDTDFAFYARHTLKIKTKAGPLVPFIMNKSQRYLNMMLDKQLREFGRVRAVVLKGRQQGSSTDITGRFYHKATRQYPKSVFILSHEGATTRKLFKMVDTFYEKSPGPMKPARDIANGNEFQFKSIGSDYSVGTANNNTVGRGGTVQLFHGSEVAHWVKTEGLETGILESVADEDGTEIILESTANGMGGFFYDTCMDAIKGVGDYIMIFLPWFWQEEYVRDVPSDGNMEITPEEQELADLYGWDKTRIYWRRSKIIKLKSLSKFMQEYPNNVLEAFQTSGERLLKANMVMLARHSEVKDKTAPKIIGVDPGRTKDRTVFVHRQGRVVTHYEEFDFGPDAEEVQMRIVGKLIQRIKTEEPDMIFIDVGEGWGVIDRLKELGYGDIVRGVHFGGGADEDDIYLNKRAEMWCRMRDWIHREEGEVSIPDDDNFQKDIMSMPKEITTSSSKIKMVEKSVIRKELKFSPDIGDACVLTFAFPVAKRRDEFGERKRIKKKNGQNGPITTLQRTRRRGNLSTSRGSRRR